MDPAAKKELLKLLPKRLTFDDVIKMLSDSGLDHKVCMKHYGDKSHYALKLSINSGPWL